MLDWVVERLAAAGVDEIVLSLGYLPAAFEAAYPDGRCGGTRLHYASEPEPLDTAGAIRFAALAAGLDRAREPFVVVNGDVLTDADLGALLDVHRSRGAEATIALTPVDDPSRYGVVPIDAEGRVTAFIEKPPADEAPSNWINAGTYVLEPSVLARIPDGRRVSIERETFPTWWPSGACSPARTPPTGSTPARPRATSRCSSTCWRAGGAPARTSPRPPTWPRARSIERAVVMEGATVAEGAIVRGSALLPGARVDRAACVVDSVLGWGSVVGRAPVWRTAASWARA